jgi:hypothetical protein
MVVLGWGELFLMSEVPLYGRVPPISLENWTPQPVLGGNGWNLLPYLKLIDSCIAQFQAQGPSRTCDESKEEDSLEFQRMTRIRPWRPSREKRVNLGENNFLSKSGNEPFHTHVTSRRMCVQGSLAHMKTHLPRSIVRH